MIENKIENCNNKLFTKWDIHMKNIKKRLKDTQKC